MDFYNAPPVALAHPNPALVSQAADLLSKAERPLIIVGKGAAHARAEEEICKLVENTKLPFLPTPMGMCEMLLFNQYFDIISRNVNGLKFNAIKIDCS